MTEKSNNNYSFNDQYEVKSTILESKSLSQISLAQSPSGMEKSTIL